jgi:tRNA(Ile)-lysidine synthase
LGAEASEATARQARYEFLHRLRRQVAAAAIITAHHQDDLIETAVINMVRGTGRKGLSSLASTEDVIRPLLNISKQEIYEYARQAAITWREDSTNEDDGYLRNYIRHQLISRISAAQRAALLAHISKAQAINPLVDTLLLEGMGNVGKSTELDRKWFIQLPHAMSCEVLAAWLRQNNIRSFDSALIERLVVAGKVAIPGKQVDIIAGFLLKVGKMTLQITPGTPRQN